MVDNKTDCLMLLWESSVTLSSCNVQSLEAVFVAGIVGLVLLFVSVLLLFLALCCTVYKIRLLKRVVHDAMEGQQSNDTENIRITKLSSNLKITEEGRKRPAHGEEEKGHEKFHSKDYNRRNKVSNKDSEIEVRGGSSALVRSSLPLTGDSSVTDEHAAANDVAEKLSIHGIQAYEKVEMTSVPVSRSNNLQVDVKGDEIIKTSSQYIAPYSEVKLSSDSFGQAGDEKEEKERVEQEVKSDHDAVCNATKEMPLYAVVNLESKRKRKALSEGKETQQDAKKLKNKDACPDDATEETPMYAVVNLKAKRNIRELQEDKKRKGQAQVVDASSGDDVSKETPLYSVINLEQKRSRLALEEKVKGEARAKGMEYQDTPLGEVSEKIPTYSTVNLECKHRRGALECANKDTKDPVSLVDNVTNNPPSVNRGREVDGSRAHDGNICVSNEVDESSSPSGTPSSSSQPPLNSTPQLRDKFSDNNN